MLVKTDIGQFANLHQADLQSLNDSPAMKGTFEQPGSFSMHGRSPLNLLPSHLRIASDFAFESSLESCCTQELYKPIATPLNCKMSTLLDTPTN